MAAIFKSTQVMNDSKSITNCFRASGMLKGILRLWLMVNETGVCHESKRQNVFLIIEYSLEFSVRLCVCVCVCVRACVRACVRVFVCD